MVSSKISFKVRREIMVVETSTDYIGQSMTPNPARGNLVKKREEKTDSITRAKKRIHLLKGE